MKNKLVLIMIVCISCNRQSGNIKSDSEFSGWLITQDSTIAKLDKLSYVEQYTLVDDELKMKFVLDSQRINITA
jgi:uncharacterized protein YpmS